MFRKFSEESSQAFASRIASKRDSTLVTIKQGIQAGAKKSIPNPNKTTSGHKENGKNLGTWLNAQRQSKKAGTPDNFRVDRLEEVGVIWNVIDDQWEDMYELLIQYNNHEGHGMGS